MSQPQTILIVEDEDLMRGILAGLLADAGFRVIEASSGEQALELFAAESPALTITDIALGLMERFARSCREGVPGRWSIKRLRPLPFCQGN